MARKVETLEIGNNRYEVTQWGAREALAIELKLTRMLGPAFASQLKPGGELPDLDSFDLPALVGAFVEHAREADVLALADAVAGSSSVRIRTMTPDGTSIVLEPISLRDHWDEHFAGRPRDALSLIAFAIRLNFADFFDGKKISRASPDLPQPAPPR